MSIVSATTSPPSTLTSETYARPFKRISLEYFLLLIAVFITTGAIDSLFGGASSDMDSYVGTLTTALRGQTEIYSPFRSALLVLPFIYSGLYLFMRWKGTLFVVERLWPAMFVVALAVISSLWSLDPDVSLRRSLNVLGGTFIGLYLVMRLTPKQFCQVIGEIFLILCLFTVASIIVMPSLAIHHDQHYPALRGFFPHKNALGSAMVVGYTLGLVLLKAPGARKIGLPLLILAAGLGIASLSRTSWVNMGVVTFAYIGLSSIRAFKSAGVFLMGLIALFLGYIIVTSSLEGLMGTVAHSLGRTSDLSGRTEIWSTLVDVMGNGPLWFGFGFESFWTSYQGALTLDWGMSGFIPYHAHNGWLQMMTDLGICGTSFLTLALIMGLWRSYKSATRSDNVLYAFSFLYLVYYTFTNLTEARFLMRDQFYWIMFLYAAIDPSWRLALPSLTHLEENTSLPKAI